MGPIERNPSVIRNNKGPPAPSLHLVSASLAIIYSCWRPSLVTMAKLSIHSGYLPGKRPPPAATTRLPNHRLLLHPAEENKRTPTNNRTPPDTPPPCTREHRHGV